MSVKNKIMAFFITVSGMFGGKAVAQETQKIDDNADATEIITPMPHDTLIETKQDSLSLYNSIVIKKDAPNRMDIEIFNDICSSEKSDSTTVNAVISQNKGETETVKSAPVKQKVSWENSPEGKKIISEYVGVLQKLGETPEIKAEDVVYIHALANFNREVAMIDGTGYVMDREDFKDIEPDSLQNDIAQDAKNWLTPAKYAGRFCGHAAKGNYFENGLLLSAMNIGQACDMEKPLSEDPNFVKFGVKKGESYCVAHGGIKIYRKTRAHPFGHIGIAIKDSTSVDSTALNDSTIMFSKDSSDKLRNRIDENNYSGVVCFFTAHSKASFATCIAAWATKYKEDNRPLVMPKDAPLSEYQVNLTPKKIFETALACKEEYFQKYTAAINNMPTDHVERNGYIFGPPKKIALLAKNAKRALVKRTSHTSRVYTRR